MSTVIKLDSLAQAHIQAYWEYKNIVGDTDGGKLLSEEEYAKRRKGAFENQKNRIYVTWLNDNNLECRAIGPSSKCFCGHKFRDHDSCNKQKKVSCKISKCQCKLFEYIPIRGSQDLKCHCKHSYKLHNITTRKCLKQHPVKGLCRCHGFISSFGCPCGQPFSSHYTLFETRKERAMAGKRVDNLAMGTGIGCAALGGITTFSSLLDGVDRMSSGSQQPPNPQISDLRLQFMRPKQKLTEEEEMALYASKYERKPMYAHLENTNNINVRHQQHMKNKLRLLKHKRRHSVPSNCEITSNMQSVKIENNHRNQKRGQHKKGDSWNWEMSQIEQRINNLEQELRNPSLTSVKKYALNKSLKVERSKIIRHQRKLEQDKRRFEAGL